MWGLLLLLLLLLASMLSRHACGAKEG